MRASIAKARPGRPELFTTLLGVDIRAESRPLEVVLRSI